jgi:hypothetical protein
MRARSLGALLALLAACGGREEEVRLELCRQALVACEADPCPDVPMECVEVKMPPGKP